MLGTVTLGYVQTIRIMNLDVFMDQYYLKTFIK